MQQNLLKQCQSISNTVALFEEIFLFLNVTFKRKQLKSFEIFCYKETAETNKSRVHKTFNYLHAKLQKLTKTSSKERFKMFPFFKQIFLINKGLSALLILKLCPLWAT